LGRVEPRPNLFLQGGELGLGVRITGGIGLLDGSQRDLPARDVIGQRDRLLMKRRHSIDHALTRRSPRLPLLEVVRGAQTAERRKSQRRRRKRKLHLAAPLFLDRPRHGHGTLALGRVRPLLDAREVGRNPVGDDLGGARSSLELDGQAVFNERDQLILGPAASQPF
jgi:hypothetical protein